MAGPESAPRKPSWSTPLLLLSFALVFLVLFNPTLRDLTGEWVGFVLTPLIGFGGRWPVLTIFLASVILVIATTVIRHFLVDWTAMARTQEAMRAFQKEFSDARKANNTYKMKKLTEAQPKVFELQAELQKDQLKPMAFTMLIVIPLFAWLGHALVQPVAFELTDAPETPAVLVGRHGENVLYATVASSDAVGQEVFRTSTDAYAYVLLPPGAAAGSGAGDVIRVQNARTGTTFQVPMDDAVVVPDAAKVADLPAGTYTVQVAAPTQERQLVLSGPRGTDAVDNAVLVVVQDGRIAQALSTQTTARTLTLDAASSLYVVVPDGTLGDPATGNGTLLLRGDESRDVELTPDHVVVVDVEDPAPIYPYSAQLPWQDPWSLQDFWWFLPHWILLYSLFGIPFGQIAQRALKLWEYRHVDLDGDGRQAGEV